MIGAVPSPSEAHGSARTFERGVRKSPQSMAAMASHNGWFGHASE